MRRGQEDDGRYRADNILVIFVMDAQQVRFFDDQPTHAVGNKDNWIGSDAHLCAGFLSRKTQLEEQFFGKVSDAGHVVLCRAPPVGIVTVGQDASGADIGLKGSHSSGQKRVGSWSLDQVRWL
jgi:hypothetical protein